VQLHVQNAIVEALVIARRLPKGPYLLIETKKIRFYCGFEKLIRRLLSEAYNHHTNRQPEWLQIANKICVDD